MFRRFLLPALALSLLLPATARADRDYSMRFGAVDRGDVTIAANTIMSCPTADIRCAGARDGTGDTIRNSAFNMTHVDVDADATTFNSSSADLVLPAGATVLFAGLYWGSDVAAGDGGVPAPDPGARGTVLLAAGSTWAYQAVTATQVDSSRILSGARYQGFADVTERVRAAGPGTYTVANVQAATGKDNFGGWGLVVAYRDGTAPVRWLGVYDGFHQLTDNHVRRTTLGGFRTPDEGTVDATFGMMTYEGDLAVTGDYLRIGGRDVTDALHPVGNFFTSLITARGEPVHTKHPDYAHQLGHEASLIDVDGFLGNDATSAAVELGTGSDYFTTGPMTLVADHAVDPPAVVSPPAIDGEARDGATLTASPGTWSGTPTYAHQWRRCAATCADLPGATGSTYVLGPADVGATIRVRVTATNRGGSAGTESAPTETVVARPPVNTAAPGVSGVAREGETLTASAGSWTGSPDLVLQWRRCAPACADIAGATGASHVLTAADVGATVRVRVTATSSGGSAIADSAETGTVVEKAPVSSAAPSVSGLALDGETLTASPGGWIGSPSFAYQWQRCEATCADLAGRTAPAYVLGPDDVASELRVRVTATNGGGSATALSERTAAVAARPPVNGGLPVVTGAAREGGTLTASPGAWSGTPTLVHAYQWRRCRLACEDVPDAIGATYVLGAADVGASLRVRVTATNTAGTTEADSAPTGVVVPAPVPAAPPAPVSPQPQAAWPPPAAVAPPGCGALTAVYTRGRAGTLRLRLDLRGPVTAIDFGVPAAMLPARRAAGRRGVGRLRAGGRAVVLRFRRGSRAALTPAGRRPRVRLTRGGARIERIGARVRRVDLTLTTRAPAPRRDGVTIVARSRTSAGALRRDACALVTRG